MKGKHGEILQAPGAFAQGRRPPNGKPPALGQGVKAAAKAGRAREAAQLADALARHRAARSEAAAARRLRHERSPERRAEEQALKEKFNQEVDRLVEQRIQERLQAKGLDPRPFLRG